MVGSTTIRACSFQVAEDKTATHPIASRGPPLTLKPGVCLSQRRVSHFPGPSATTAWEKREPNLLFSWPPSPSPASPTLRPHHPGPMLLHNANGTKPPIAAETSGNHLSANRDRSERRINPRLTRQSCTNSATPNAGTTIAPPHPDPFPPSERKVRDLGSGQVMPHLHRTRKTR